MEVNKPSNCEICGLLPHIEKNERSIFEPPLTHLELMKASRISYYMESLKVKKILPEKAMMVGVVGTGDAYALYSCVLEVMAVNLCGYVVECGG